MGCITFNSDLSTKRHISRIWIRSLGWLIEHMTSFKNQEIKIRFLASRSLSTLSARDNCSSSFQTLSVNSLGLEDLCCHSLPISTREELIAGRDSASWNGHYILLVWRECTVLINRREGLKQSDLPKDIWRDIGEDLERSCLSPTLNFTLSSGYENINQPDRTLLG